MSDTNLTPDPRGPQRKPAQTSDSAKAIADSTQDHMMPGMVALIAETFLTPRKHYTVRGVARRLGIPVDFVVTGLLRFLLDRTEARRAADMQRVMSSDLRSLGGVLGTSRSPVSSSSSRDLVGKRAA